MDGIRFTEFGADLEAEFFREKPLCFSTQGLSNNRNYDIFGAILEKKSMWFRMGLNLGTKEFSLGERLIGTLKSMQISKELNPFLIYHQVKKVDNQKIIQRTCAMNLDPNDKNLWFRYLINPENKKGYDGLCLYLPPRMYLDSPERI